MNFERYLLLEFDEPERRTKPITRDRALELLTTKHSIAFDSRKKAGKSLYRGVPKGDSYMLYAYADPSSRERTSRNTRNFYTILFDNLPSWTKYPKRSRSLVCSTDPSRPRGYGQPFYLFPENGSKIGVCPSYDIWGSFDTVTNDYNLSSFNDYFWMFLRDSMNAIDRSYPAEPKNFAEMVVYFDEIDKHKKYVVQFIKNEFGSTPDSVDFRYKAFPVKEYINTPSMKLIDYLDKMFDPEKNGFMLKTPGNSIPKNRETWTDSPCVMIHYDESVEEDSIYKLLED